MSRSVTRLYIVITAAIVGFTSRHLRLQWYQVWSHQVAFAAAIEWTSIMSVRPDSGGTNGDVFSIQIDLHQFSEEEIAVKIVDGKIVVIEARHDERDDPSFGSVSRHFLHRYRLPNNIDPAQIRSDRNEDGILTIFALKDGIGNMSEMIISIERTTV